jgi:3-hydroxybutyryl-CoA dehydrogenase
MNDSKNPALHAAVIGAGTMGTQVALLLAANGHKVTLVDIAAGQLQASEQKMKEDIRMMQLMGGGETVYDTDCISRIRFTQQISDIAGARIVVENINENESLKKELYASMHQWLAGDAVYAVNTSCVPIASIAAMVPDPGQVIGCHFMNPVYLKKLVEVIRSSFTADDVIAFLTGLLKSLGKRVVVVNDAPGFVANRLSHLLMNEAARVIEEKICKPADLDLIFKAGYGHAMGPLETADLIGIDTVVDSLRVLEEHTGNHKFTSCSLLRDMVEQGNLGRKTGKGFFTYQ